MVGARTTQGALSHMFERFTDRARRVVVLAQEEARMLSHNYIGTEHILLGHAGWGSGRAIDRPRTGIRINKPASPRIQEIKYEPYHAPRVITPKTPGSTKDAVI